MNSTIVPPPLVDQDFVGDDENDILNEGFNLQNIATNKSVENNIGEKILIVPHQTETKKNTKEMKEAIEFPDWNKKLELEWQALM
jgi:hypothetical protein